MGSHRFNGRLVFFFILGLILNAGGNALTVALNLGSPVWTATCVNVAHALHVSLGLIMVYWGAALIIATILITRKIQGWRTVKNVVFMVLFAALVNWLSKWFEQTPLMTLPIIVRVLLDFGGIGLIAAGVSLYQRVNWMLHPCDDLMQIVRFRFLKETPTGQCSPFIFQQFLLRSYVSGTRIICGRLILEPSLRLFFRAG